ncbi:type VI secretion system membrane subunit TssM, partial [Citrobacter freundii]
MFRLPTPRLFSGLKSALRPAMPRFKVSAFWLLVLAWIFLLVWIWWKGPAWSLYEEHWLKPLANRWLATAIWGLIALIWLTVRVMKRLQQLERQQKQQREETQDPVSVELNAQQRYLDRWLLRLQRHLDSRRYLWQLPWYMVVGPAGSGKTALLREGFPADIIYTPEAVRGTGQRLYITPHVGKQAVIFDPDGVLCEQQDTEVLPRRLWEHWLGWLVQKRARQPLNGLILTLDLPDLLTADKHRREHLVQLLRSRLQDVRQHLHCQLPVYVVLTRLDLLTGFAALFHSLDKQGRDAILGVTFTRHAHENDDWRVELKAFWQTWGEQLNNALPDLMLAQNHDRSALFSFVRQMQGCHDVLAVLLGSLLDGENMDVMLRGIYLTSSLQRGQMDDIFMQSAARQYLLGSSPLAAWPLVDTRPYFTRCLFPLALLAEPNLSGENSVWLGNTRRRMMGVAACSAVLIVLAAGGWHHYYNTNWNAGVRVLEQARAFMSVPPPQGVDDYGNLQLPLLNPVRDATLAYGDWGDRSRFADLGLYQGRNIGPYVEQTYLQLLEQRYLTSLSNGLIKDLAAAPQGSEQKLAVLRVVRMLEDKSGRNDAVVKQYMAKRWSEQFHGQRDIQAQLMSHLDYALKHTDWHAAREQGDNDAISRWAPYDKPVADAQNELSKLPVYQRVYQSLKTRAQGVLPADLNLRDQVGPTFELVFVSGDDNKLVVPQLLTRHGLQGYFVKQRDALVELTAMDSWVLNITRSVKYSDADRAEIQRQLTEQYLSDYTATWRAGMDNLNVRDYESIAQLTGALEQIISGDQPLQRALTALRDNTHSIVLPEKLDDKEREEARSAADY